GAPWGVPDPPATFGAAPAPGKMVTVSAGAFPMWRSGRVHVTAVSPPHVQPSPPAETSVAPAGSVSATDTAVARDGPALATSSVYVSGTPWQIDAGAPVMAIDRSAYAAKVAVNVAGADGVVIVWLCAPPSDQLTNSHVVGYAPCVGATIVSCALTMTVCVKGAGCVSVPDEIESPGGIDWNVSATVWGLRLTLAVDVSEPES